jgi:hypothetical protein
MPETCALDLAERGGMTLDQVGALLNMTRERARQIENAALAKMRANGAPDEPFTTIAVSGGALGAAQSYDNASWSLTDHGESAESGG